MLLLTKKQKDIRKREELIDNVIKGFLLLFAVSVWFMLVME